MSSSKKGKVVFVLLIVITLGGFIGYRFTYKPHPKTSELTSTYQGSASAFIPEVTQNVEKWQNQIVEIEGLVTSSTPSGITIREQIFCQFESENNSTIPVGKTIIIKGRFIGYDDLLEEIKLDKCVPTSTIQ